MPKRGKKYLEAAAKVDRENLYTPEEAVDLVKEIRVNRLAQGGHPAGLSRSKRTRIEYEVFSLDEFVLDPPVFV